MSYRRTVRGERARISTSRMGYVASGATRADILATMAPTLTVQEPTRILTTSIATKLALAPESSPTLMTAALAPKTAVVSQPVSDPRVAIQLTSTSYRPLLKVQPPPPVTTRQLTQPQEPVTKPPPLPGYPTQLVSTSAVPVSTPNPPSAAAWSSVSYPGGTTESGAELFPEDFIPPPPPSVEITPAGKMSTGAKIGLALGAAALIYFVTR